MKNQKGFSLIEALISVVILAVGLLGATLLQIKINASTQLARQRTDAVSLAQRQLEIMKDSGTCSLGTQTLSTNTATYTLVVTCQDSSTPIVNVSWSDTNRITGGSNTITLSSAL